jgi:hypothetical protein
MGFDDNKETEEIYERYVELCEKAVLIDIIESNREMGKLAREIYQKVFLNRTVQTKTP